MTDSISVVCPNCRAKMRAPAAMAGRTAPCPKCKTRVSVEAPVTTPTNANDSPDIDNGVDEVVRLLAASEQASGQDDRSIERAYLTQAERAADALLAGRPDDAAGLMAKGLALARRGDLSAAAGHFTQAVRRGGHELGKPGAAKVVDFCKGFYDDITFMADDQLGVPVPPGKAEAVAALRKVLILADRDAPEPGSRARALLDKARGLPAVPQAPPARPEEAPAVRCPACQEELRGYVARCPHCTSVLNWMNCPDCRQKVATRVTQKFGVARNGYQPVYHCLKCGKKLAGPDCFIATAAYGSAAEPQVEVLRAFRDRVLLRSGAGRALVGGYYAVSPALAARIRHRPMACRGVRLMLRPVVWAAGSTDDGPK